MSGFRIEFDGIEHGWVNLTIYDNEKEVMFSFENVPSDPLSELLRSALRISAGQETITLFCNGAEKTRFCVQIIDAHICNMSIADNCFQTTRRQFMRAVVRAFDQYVHVYGRQSFKENWGAYPESALTRLRNL